MGDTDFDQKVAELASLLECGVETAREALCTAAGDMTRAISIAFEGNSPSTSSSKVPELSAPEITMHIDDDSDIAHEAGIPSQSASASASQPAAAAAPSAPEITKPTDDGSDTAHDAQIQSQPASARASQAAATSAPSSPQCPSGHDLTSVVGPLWPGDHASTSAGSVPHGDPKSKPGSSPQQRPMAKFGFLVGEFDVWTSIPNATAVEKNWVSSRLELDPPSLRLSRDTKRKVPNRGNKMSTGDVHVHRGHDLRVHIHGPDARFAQVCERGLAAHFKGFLQAVRYPASSLELSWRVSGLKKGFRWQRATCDVPEDLKGQLLPRPFALLDNKEDAPAEQPPHFRSHALRPEQLRSLAWMQERETGAHGDEMETLEPHCVEWRHVLLCSAICGEYRDYHSEYELTVDLRVRAAYSVPGGILGDKVGYGKTATIIGLIDASLQKGTPSIPSHDSGSFIPAKGTLIIVPSNLLQQWLVEITKFVGAPGTKLKSLVARVQDLPLASDANEANGIEGLSSLKILALSNVFPLSRVTAKDVAEADIVLCSYRLLYSDIYQRRRLAIAGSHALHKLTAATRNLISEGNVTPQLTKLAKQQLSRIKRVNKKWAESRSERLRMHANKRIAAAKAEVLKAQKREADLLARAKAKAKAKTAAKAKSAAKSKVKKNVTFKAKAKSRASQTASSSTETMLHWTNFQFPLLEMFYWKRCVFDEFHELEGFASMQQNSLQHIRAHCRWGLTGTPPVDTTAGVIFMSSLFRIDLPGKLPSVSQFWMHKRPQTAVSVNDFEEDRLVTEGAAHFCDRYMRQNTAELPNIALEEHMILVQHSAAERALYMGQAHDAPDLDDEEAFACEDSLKALEKLVQLCSHFQTGASGGRGRARSKNAKQECQRISDKKEQRAVRAQNQLSRGVRVLVLLERKLQRHCVPWTTEVLSEHRRQLVASVLSKAKQRSDAADAALSAAVGEAVEETTRQTLSVLTGHRAKEPQLLALLGEPIDLGHTRQQWDRFRTKSVPNERLEKLVAAQVSELARHLGEVRDALMSLDYFRRVLSFLTEASDEAEASEARSCCVCLDENLALSKLAITPCSHTFCLKCLRLVVGEHGECSVCRHKLKPEDVRPVTSEVKELPSSSSSSAPASEVLQHKSEYAKYGTKLAVMMEKLHGLRQEDPTAKVILFVQFDELKGKVAEVLEEFGISVAQLHGSVDQRAKTIRDWQNNQASSTFVLLLSLAHSASGTNLTAASHVIFLHPMLAATPEQAAAYELQAIGRARRHGQRRSVVHIWRFVTVDTVEEEMTKRHQSALWAREAAAPRHAANVGRKTKKRSRT